MNNRAETLIPKLGVITDVRIDTPDIKTFRVVTPDGKKAFDHRPGQCAMLSIPGVGEAMFSITSSAFTNSAFHSQFESCINVSLFKSDCTKAFQCKLNHNWRSTQNRNLICIKA